MSLDWELLSNRVLIKEEMETKVGSIILVSAQKKGIGTVIKAGPGKITDKGCLIPMSLKVGDRVQFNQHADQKAVIDGEEYLIMTEADIVCVYNA